MDIQWNEQQKVLYRRFAALGTSLAARGLTDEDQFDHRAWQAIAEAGLWKLPIEASMGGSGGSWWDFAAALEGFASRIGDLGFLLSMVAHAGAVRVIATNGTPRQIDRWMPILLGGGVASTAITEERGGSDVARIQTCASASPSALVLTGKKSHITNAPIADMMVVVGRLAHLPEKESITLFLVDAHQRGVTLHPNEDLLGNRGSPTGDVSFDEAELAAESVLGAPGRGLDVLYRMISLDRLLYGLIAAAHAEPMLRMAQTHAAERIAFGQPIGRFQYVQDHIVSIKVNMEVSRHISYAAMHHLLSDSPEAVLMCSAAKLIGTEGLWESAQNLLQLHGHGGYMNGPIAKMLRDVAGTRIAGGTSDIQKVNIFNQLSKLAATEARNE